MKLLVSWLFLVFPFHIFGAVQFFVLISNVNIFENFSLLICTGKGLRVSVNPTLQSL